MSDLVHGEWEAYCQMLRELTARAEQAEVRVKELEGIILRTGLWHYAPCCICGYKGPGYFQPETHKCARGGEEK